MKTKFFLIFLTILCFLQAQNPVLRSATSAAYTALNAASNLSDIGSASTSKTNLGILRAQTSAITGTLTGVGACTSATTVNVTGVTNTTFVAASPVTPTVGASPSAWVSSNGVVSVTVCTLLATLTLTSSAYNVIAVIQ